MAFDAFLKLDGIPGDSVDQFHKGQIEILGWEETVTLAVNRIAQEKDNAILLRQAPQLLVE